MLTLESQMTVDGLTGRQITDFLLECDDDRYQRGGRARTSNCMCSSTGAPTT